MTQADDITPVLRPGRAPLVGRARELAILADALAEAAAGRPSVVLLAGEPGIGKTRLLDEFPPPELAAGVHLLRSGASEAEGMPPYLPFIEALEAYVASAETEALRADVGPNASLLARLLPQVESRLKPIEAPTDLAPEHERLRLYEAIAALLRGITTRATLVVTLDDLQWVDAASCDLLVHVVRRLRTERLLVLGAYRADEAEDNPWFVRARAELNRLRLLREIPLRRLNPEESRAVAAGLLGDELAPAAAELLHQQGEGNPFFEEELLRALVEQGGLARGERRWELRGAPDRLLPSSLSDIVRLRVGRLEPAVGELLRLAALVGRSFEVELLATVLRIDPDQAEQHLLRAVRANLVRPEPDGRFAFTHDKVREALGSEIGGAQRRRLHLAIGEALEAMDGPTEGRARRLAERAFHFIEAGDQTRGVAYALAAAEQALRAQAATEAAGYYRAAAELLVDHQTDARRLAALLGLGEASTLAGDLLQAVESYQAAVAAALAAGDTAAAARAWRGLGLVRWRRELLHDAAAAFEQALALTEPVESAEAAETLLLLADLQATSLGLHSEGLAAAERALAAVERLGDPRLQVVACRVVGNLKLRTSQLAEARSFLERALTLAEQRDQPDLAAETCGYLANLYWILGEHQRSWEITDR
jgi:predicted ATPase